MLSTVWRAAAKSILLVKTWRLMGVEAIAQRHLLHLGGPGFQAHLSYFVYRRLNTCYKTPKSPFLGAKLREASVLMALRSAVEKTSIVYSKQWVCLNSNFPLSKSIGSGRTLSSPNILNWRPCKETCLHDNTPGIADWVKSNWFNLFACWCSSWRWWKDDTLVDFRVLYFHLQLTTHGLSKPQSHTKVVSKLVWP